MDGTIPGVLALGLGNGTFSGSPALLVTLGFGAATAVTGDAAVIRRTANFAYTRRRAADFRHTKRKSTDFDYTRRVTVDF